MKSASATVGSSSSRWNAVGSSSTNSGAFNNQAVSPELTEEELEKQYSAYKSQFEEWIAKNRNHPDRDAYNRYVNQFKDWEAQVENNRRAIREWKASRGEAARGGGDEREGQAATTSKRANEVMVNSEASSPPLSSTSGKKKKKLKKKKIKKEVAAAAGEDPMMAMMKMMAAAAAATAGAASAPAPVPVPTAMPMPMDPLSVMMAMTMMMPMMMNTAPNAAPSTTETTPVKSTTAPAPLPDVSRPPPVFVHSDDDRPKQRYHHHQAERDREFRSDRSQGQHGQQFARPRLSRSPVPFDRQFNQRPSDDRDADRDFAYQRWLANRQQEAAQVKVDPWLPARQPQQVQPSMPMYPQGPMSSGPVPLWQAGGGSSGQEMRMTLDRDIFNSRGGDGGGAPYVSRSHFGARDFSMRRQNQNSRRWD